MPPLTALGFYFAGFYKMSQCSTMASVSNRPERKLDEIVTPRAAMMTARTSSNGNGGKLSPFRF